MSSSCVKCVKPSGRRVCNPEPKAGDQFAGHSIEAKIIIKRMNALRLILSVMVLAGVCSSPVAAEVSFEREVLPLLEKRCNQCHHPEKQRGGLDLTRIETMRRGGDELGVAIIPGKPDESPLIQTLTGAVEPKMPEEGNPLPPPEIDLLRRWISEGAKDDSPVFSTEAIMFFEKEIRPILAGRCFKCHAGEQPEHGLRLTSRYGILAGGLRGPAAVPGKPQPSLLVQAIRHDGDLKMPRNGDRLSGVQVAAFEKWIEMGLPWPADQKVLARQRKFTISEADRNHWAFRPLPPNESQWNIDAALRPHHRRLGIKPAKQAPRHQLLRRVTYDLIGYPPTPEEIKAFVNDASPDAYEKVVTRLLDSPLFGWRWGRHWLDYTRNGSTGQPTRGPAIDASRYQAWVVRCFNEDRPWDWFARVHIAGDKMPAYEGGDYSIDQALAAAVPINGPRTFERAAVESFVLMDKLDEGIEFLGRSLMGVSLECARCHDHKFDPISQRDYYALLGFFQSSGHAPIPVDTKSRAKADQYALRLAALMKEKSTLEGRLRREALIASIAAKKTLGIEGRKHFINNRTIEITPKAQRLHEIDLILLKAELADAKSKGKTRLADDIREAVHEKEAMLADFHFSAPNLGPSFDHFINGHKSQIGLIERAETVGMTELAAELKEHDVFWADERKLWGRRYRFGGFPKTDPAVSELARMDDRIQEIEAELPANVLRQWEEPKPAHLYVRTDGGLRRAEELKAMPRPAGITLNANDPKIAWLVEPYIGDARFLQRGDVLYPGELVPRGFPVFFGKNKPQIQGSGRLQLAQWLTQRDSIQAALIARTAVNRAWQKLFGEALCRTPKELGRLGETPELPEIIDSLAARFVANDWSIKSVVREIVTSDAYQRDSVGPRQGIDLDNRHFTRQSVRRLEYEPIANTMAWLVAGQRFDSPQARDSALPSAADYLRQFDAPPPIDLVDRRTASITATQALFLMNQPNGAHGIAGKLLKRIGGDASVEEIFTIVLGRPPTPRELALAHEFDKIADFVAALLCVNETIYLD